MKQFVIVLLLSLLVPIASSSQTTYPVTIGDSLVIITADQLKYTNLIFNEHRYLTEKVNILENQISNLEKLNFTYVEQDSIRCKQIEEYKNAYEDSFNKYNRLNNRYKIAKVVSISSILVLLGSLLWR